MKKSGVEPSSPSLECGGVHHREGGPESLGGKGME